MRAPAIAEKRGTVTRMLRVATSIILLSASPVSGQHAVWHNEFRFYGDNTEFFSSFRKGETLLGGQFHSFVSLDTSEHTEVLAGVFGDQPSGSAEFLETVKPLLSFRYQTRYSLGVLGTLETVYRHGLLEPLQATTLEITRPVEYGLQWIESRELWNAEAFLNWQALKTEENREVFDFGLVLSVRPLPYLAIELQGHGKHRGGQGTNGREPVGNNLAGGPGIRITGALPAVREGSFEIFRLWSDGILNEDVPDGRPDQGAGTYVRISAKPGFGEFFTILWRGRDFLSDEGDNHYNSVGFDPTFYRSKRRYTEIGFVRELTIDDRAVIGVEFRLHKIDGEDHGTFFGTLWDYSYRIVVDVPFEVPIIGGN